METQVTSKTVIARLKPMVVQSKNVVCDDNVTRSNVLLTPEYARNIGIVSSYTHDYNRSNRRPRTRAGKVAECVSIMPDGTRKVIVQGARFSNKNTVKPRKIIVVKEPTYRNNYEARLAMLGRTTEGAY